MKFLKTPPEPAHGQVQWAQHCTTHLFVLKVSFCHLCLGRSSWSEGSRVNPGDSCVSQWESKVSHRAEVRLPFTSASSVWAQWIWPGHCCPPVLSSLLGL